MAFGEGENISLVKKLDKRYVSINPFFFLLFAREGEQLLREMYWTHSNFCKQKVTQAILRKWKTTH